MKYIGSCIVWLCMAVFLLLPVSTSVAVSDHTGATCPLLKTVVHHLKQINRGGLGVSGFDLAESFSLRQTSCGGEKNCFKLGSAPLVRDTNGIGILSLSCSRMVGAQCKGETTQHPTLTGWDEGQKLMKNLKDGEREKVTMELDGFKFAWGRGNRKKQLGM